jgi:hypothetical protein
MVQYGSTSWQHAVMPVLICSGAGYLRFERKGEGAKRAVATLI